MLLKVKRLQNNVNKFYNNASTNRIPGFSITSQSPGQTNMFDQPNEEKIKNAKPKLTEHQMDYEVMEDIKKVRANISLFGMCNLPQQKETLLKAL